MKWPFAIHFPCTSIHSGGWDVPTFTHARRGQPGTSSSMPISASAVEHLNQNNNTGWESQRYDLLNNNSHYYDPDYGNSCWQISNGTVVMFHRTMSFSWNINCQSTKCWHEHTSTFSICLRQVLETDVCVCVCVWERERHGEGERNSTRSGCTPN